MHLSDTQAYISLEILTKPRVGGRRLVVYTDCRGLVTGLAQGPLIQKELRMAAIWKLLYRILDGYVDRLVIQWIPGHCGLKRNEKADKNAKTHFKLMEQNASDAHEKVPSSYGATKSYYKEVLTASRKASTSELTHRGAIAGPKFTNIKAKETGRTSMQFNLSRSYPKCTSEVGFNLGTDLEIWSTEAMFG